MRVPSSRQGAEAEAATGAHGDPAGDSVTLYPRPQLKTTYDAPTNEIERTTAAIWQEILGVERPSGMVLIERCCAGTPTCPHCAAGVGEAVPG